MHMDMHMHMHMHKIDTHTCTHTCTHTHIHAHISFHLIGFAFTHMMNGKPFIHSKKDSLIREFTYVGVFCSPVLVVALALTLYINNI